MSLFDAKGQVVRKITDEQIITALNALAQRHQNQQMQLMQLGILVEYLIEKSGIVIDEDEFSTYAEKRYAEIRAESQRIADLTAKKVDLEE